MSAVATIENTVRSSGHECSVERTKEGRVVCRIDGDTYSPLEAANKFILGGWAAVWKD